jgi:hypothetical protein
MSRFDERKPMTADVCGKPTPGEPGAVKVACPVRKGGWENTVRLCVLSLPTYVNGRWKRERIGPDKQAAETVLRTRRVEIAIQRMRNGK